MADICKNYHKGADTSIEAYAQTPEKSRSKIRYAILAKIKELGNATCDEIEQLLNLSHQCASARISELNKDNLIEDTGERRLTRLGRKARVYTPREVAHV